MKTPKCPMCNEQLEIVHEDLDSEPIFYIEHRCSYIHGEGFNSINFELSIDTNGCKNKSEAIKEAKKLFKKFEEWRKK